MKANNNSKPVAQLIGANGNIFNLLNIANNTLTSLGKYKEAEEMFTRVTSSSSYDEAIDIIGDYVEFGLVGPE